MAQSVERPNSAQVMISKFLSSGPESDYADSSEPGACFRFCISLSLCPSPVHALSLKNNVKKLKKSVEKNAAGVGGGKEIP